MQTYIPGRKGRRKVVDQFKIRNGLWIVAVITAVLVAFLVLGLLGYFNFDVH